MLGSAFRSWRSIFKNMDERLTSQASDGATSRCLANRRNIRQVAMYRYVATTIYVFLLLPTSYLISALSKDWSRPSNNGEILESSTTSCNYIIAG